MSGQDPGLNPHLSNFPVQMYDLGNGWNADSDSLGLAQSSKKLLGDAHILIQSIVIPLCQTAKSNSVQIYNDPKQWMPGNWGPRVVFLPYLTGLSPRWCHRRSLRCVFVQEKLHCPIKSVRHSRSVACIHIRVWPLSKRPLGFTTASL
jgi:hypothetical protein